MSEKRVNKLGKVLVTLLLLPAAVIVPVLSLESHYAPPTQAQTQPDSAQAARIKAYKAELVEEIKKGEQDKIRLRCSVAQANAKILATRLASVQKKRGEAYDKILGDLNVLLGKLENQAYETTALKENITTLQTKVDTYKTGMNNYYLAVNDLATIDCPTDPVAFAAALQASRKAHQAVQPQMTDIRAYITNTVKPTLVQVREQIAAGRTVGGSQ
jgi:hypothetical protein